MTKIPQYRITQRSDFGINIRRIEAVYACPPDAGSDHRDNFYIFGVLTGGSGEGFIDFVGQHLVAGNVFIIRPGQVHRFVNAHDAEGWILLVDSGYMDEDAKRVLEDFSLYASSLGIDRGRQVELDQIAGMIASRTGRVSDKPTKTTLRCLVGAFVSVIAEAISECSLWRDRGSRRYIEIVLALRHLMEEHVVSNRQPSYYASLLNISTVYLNQVVKGVTGMSTAAYIQNAIVLRAKRLLINTRLSVKEIAYALGFDDCAYFSRLFARVTAMPPSVFRQKYRE